MAQIYTPFGTYQNSFSILWSDLASPTWRPRLGVPISSQILPKQMNDGNAVPIPTSLPHIQRIVIFVYILWVKTTEQGTTIRLRS